MNGERNFVCKQTHHQLGHDSENASSNLSTRKLERHKNNYTEVGIRPNVRDNMPETMAPI